LKGVKWEERKHLKPRSRWAEFAKQAAELHGPAAKQPVQDAEINKENAPLSAVPETHRQPTPPSQNPSFTSQKPTTRPPQAHIPGPENARGVNVPTYEREKSELAQAFINSPSGEARKLPLPSVTYHPKNLLVSELRIEPQEVVDPVPDGAMLPLIGSMLPEVDMNKPKIYFVPGIGALPASTYGYLESLAKSSGRPIQGVYNKTDGKVFDTLHAISDKLFEESTAFDDSVKTVTLEILDRIRSEEGMDLVGYSQGSILVQKSASRAVKDIDWKVQHGQLDQEEANRMLGQLRVVLVGSCVEAKDFDQRLKVKELIDPKDIVSQFCNAGPESIFKTGKIPPGAGLKSHDFENYVDKVQPSLQDLKEPHSQKK